MRLTRKKLIEDAEAAGLTVKRSFHSSGVEITRGDRGVIVYGTWVMDAADRTMQRAPRMRVAEAFAFLGLEG